MTGGVSRQFHRTVVAFEDEVSTESGSDRVIVLAISIIAIGFDPVATALGTDTLTARHKEHAEPIPMCGVPHHSAANYIARLVRKGYRVAICEQTEEPSKAKKLVRREVVRIVTPGTPVDPQLLEPRESVYLAATCAQGEAAGAAFLDRST